MLRLLCYQILHHYLFKLNNELTVLYIHVYVLTYINACKCHYFIFKSGMLEIAVLKLLARFECNLTPIIPLVLASQTKATPFITFINMILKHRYLASRYTVSSQRVHIQLQQKSTASITKLAFPL